MAVFKIIFTVIICIACLAFIIYNVREIVKKLKENKDSKANDVQIDDKKVSENSEIFKDEEK